MKVFYSLLPLATLALAPLAHAQTTYTYASVDYPGAANTQLNGINSSGTIVGTYLQTPTGNTAYSFLRSPDGNFTPLLVGVPSESTGISDSGIIVGSVGKTGFILSKTYIPVQSSKYATYLRGISTNNLIVGTFNDEHGTGYGFEIQEGNLRRLPYYNEGPVAPFGINSAGTIVGFPESTANGAFILPVGGTFQILEYPGAVFGTNLSAINDQGVSAGSQFGSPSGYAQGFTYNGAVFSDVVYPGSVGTYPYGINNNGVVVGLYYDSNFVTHGFIATPVP